MVESVQICCGCCGKIFIMCKSCYRGHKYCSEECREAGYRETHSIAQKKYRNTKKGQLQHNEAEKRRYRRKKGKKK